MGRIFGISDLPVSRIGVFERQELPAPTPLISSVKKAAAVYRENQALRNQTLNSKKLRGQTGEFQGKRLDIESQTGVHQVKRNH